MISNYHLKILCETLGCRDWVLIRY